MKDSALVFHNMFWMYQVRLSESTFSNEDLGIITQALGPQRGVEYVRSTFGGLVMAAGWGWRAPMSAYNYSIFMNHKPYN